MYTHEEGRGGDATLLTQSKAGGGGALCNTDTGLPQLAQSTSCSGKKRAGSHCA